MARNSARGGAAGARTDEWRVAMLARTGEWRAAKLARTGPWRGKKGATGVVWRGAQARQGLAPKEQVPQAPPVKGRRDSKIFGESLALVPQRRLRRDQFAHECRQ